MADYWKSNDRKYCDFCKCWIADNKPSVQFHENGRRHKLNVQKRITEISRSSYKAQLEQSKMDADLKRMNEAATKAYMQDITAGADITARATLHERTRQQEAEEHVAQALATAGPAPRPKIGREADPLYIPGDISDDDTLPKKFRAEVIAAAEKRQRIEEISKLGHTSLWVEAVSDEGYPYYWNIKSGESLWEPPQEGFMKKEEYERISHVVWKKQEQALKSEAEHEVANAPEIAARLKREHMAQAFKQNRRAKEELEKIADTRRQVQEDAEIFRATNPYGKWQTVETREMPPADLGLPVVPEPLYTANVAPDECEEEQTFEEKVIDYVPGDIHSSLNDTFKKKRKVQRNARQRLDVD